MNERTANLSICEMRKHLFERLELLYDRHQYEDGNSIANEWLLDGRRFNPDNDPSYEFLVEVFHKKTKQKRYKNFSDLDF